MSNCYDPCNNSCEALDGLYEKAANLIIYSNLINAWLNGSIDGIVNIAGTNTPTLLNLINTFQQNSNTLLTNFQTTANGKLADFQNRINNIPLSIVKPNGGIYVDDDGLLYVNFNDMSVDIIKPMIQVGGGIDVDQDGKLYINFDKMPTDKFEAMLKSLRLPIWLTSDKDFYVNKATGSDTLDDGRGQSPGKPFKTILACVRYIANNYNVGDYTARILIADNTYNEPIVLPGFSRNNGKIIITSLSGNRNNVIINCALPRSSTMLANGGVWDIDGVTLDLRSNLSEIVGTTPVFASVVMASGTAEVALKNNVYRFAPTGNSSTVYNAYLLRAINGGSIDIEAGDGINRIETGSFPSNVSVTIMQAYNNGYLWANGTSEATKQVGLQLNANYNICAHADNGYIRFATSAPIKPHVTNIATPDGIRYMANNGGKIDTGSGGPDFFPGSNNGIVNAETYSWYR